MLATQDQENRVHTYQQAASSKPLNHRGRGEPPKTPGNKFPKTPFKIPLRDENAPTGFGDKKSLLGMRAKALIPGSKSDVNRDKEVFITPVGMWFRPVYCSGLRNLIGPQSRAPLAIKTANAKTKPFQTPARDVGNKDVEKAQVKPTSTYRQKQKTSYVDTIKLNVLGDQTNAPSGGDVEYCPPKPKDLPYESEDFPDGCLNYDMLKGPNLMRGWQGFYYDRVDENGVPRKERQFNDAVAKALKEGDERVRKAVEEAEWTVADVPETFIYQQKAKKSTHLSRGPTTVTSKNAAAALSVSPNAPPISPNLTKAKSKNVPLFRRKKPAPPAPEARSATAVLASRSTIGYTKGRSTSHVLHTGSDGDPKPSRNLLTGSRTIIPSLGPAKRQSLEDSISEWRRLQFLRVFDADDEGAEQGLEGELPDILKNSDDEGEFFLTLGGV